MSRILGYPTATPTDNDYFLMDNLTEGTRSCSFETLTEMLGGGGGVPDIQSVTDNTVIFLVEPSDFTYNEETERYEATIEVEGMTDGTTGKWDIVRSGPVLTLEESKIAADITDVFRLNDAIKIATLEVPPQRYMMLITGSYPDVQPGTVILSGMQEWFDRVEEKEKYEWGDMIDITNYTKTNPYICPCDGYVRGRANPHTNPNYHINICINEDNGNLCVAGNDTLYVSTLVFVRKGSTVYITSKSSSGSAATFIKLV